MTAKTKWWLCGVCGFQNHPRGVKANSLNQLQAGELHDNSKCEQCGASSQEDDATDYTPQGRA